jgi:hypothetical protein
MGATTNQIEVWIVVVSCLVFVTVQQQLNDNFRCAMVLYVPDAVDALSAAQLHDIAACIQY